MIYKPTNCTRYWCENSLQNGRCKKTYVNGTLDSSGNFTCYSADMSAWSKKESSQEAEFYKGNDWFTGKRQSKMR